VVKNKLAPPFRQAEFDIMVGQGLNRFGELVDLGVKVGIVEKSGAWFSCMSQRIGQGKENAKEFLFNHPEMAKLIEDAILKKADDIVPVSESEADQEGEEPSD
jgi:recombination protein RecA